ncbi:hypothetical protein CN884_22710 [Ochrobactrum sp. 30A/1000/2015]|nr:hypothetical protein CN884_22710 [Ochrobactrum sp. 30A/1000/2015]PJT37420.1 hypothetical protein CN883_18200 [Ochrobactrum sp. 27A/999/2015]PJT41320.1 hypothetical protein CN882_21870 [Ochrobactrum sp. 23A/997/2015]
MTTLPEEVKNAVAKALRESRWLVPAPAVELILTAALPFLSVQGAVKKLEWGNARITEDGREAEDAESPVGRYIATDTGWFLLGRTGYEVERGLYQAKAAAQADYEARILSALEPSAARELALDVEFATIRAMIYCYEGDSAQAFEAQKALAKIDAAIRALSSPDHAEAGKVEGDGWRPIESAPKNKAIQIYIPNADYYGNDGIYAGILVDLGTGQRWATFGWAVARDLPPHMHPTHWRPLPSAPSQEAAGS